MNRICALLLRPGGTVSGRLYFAFGLTLFIIKYCVDWTLAKVGFGVLWWPTHYIFRPWFKMDAAMGNTSHTWLAVSLLIAACPFIWIGTVLTIKRLRTLGWPVSLALLFFWPLLNLVFFVILILKPTPADVPSSTVQPPGRGRQLGSARLVVSLTILSTALVVFATVRLESYGWGLFVGIPFTLGFIPGLLYRPDPPPSFRDCFRLVLVTECILGTCLLFFAMEGAICLIMAAPVVVLASAIGTSVGLIARRAGSVCRQRAEIVSTSVILLPVLLLLEARAPKSPAVFEVTSSMTIDAPPATVWQSVIAFPELPPPTELLFKAGIAYPIRAEIKGAGPGAIRYCVFSTGSFVEPVEVWREPELLRFTVSTNPPPMREWSPYTIDPAHLHGFLESKRGQFELKPNDSGGTDLVGTTWYQHGLWPEAYWRLWSDYLIHTIHLRVLRHIKKEAGLAALGANAPHRGAQTRPAGP